MSIILAWFIGFGIAFVVMLWFIHMTLEYVKENKGWAAIACFVVAIGLSCGGMQIAQKIVTDVAVSYYKRGQTDGLNYCLQIAEEIKMGSEFFPNSQAYCEGYERGMTIKEGEAYNCPYYFAERKADFYAWYEGFAAAWDERNS